MLKHLNTHFFLVPVFMCYTLISKAQFTDSIMHALRQKPRAYGALNGRNSFVQNQKSPINGIKLGLNFKSQFVFGLSYNWMNNGIEIGRASCRERV